MVRKHSKSKQVSNREYRPSISKQTQQDLIQFMFRRQKRELIKRGVIQDPANRPSRFKFVWKHGNLGGVVYADGRSEARAIIKRTLGIPKKKRLPQSVDITRELNVEGKNEDSTGSTEPDSDSEHQRAEACATI